MDVTTPNNAHAEIAIAALEAGKHVACEKPLAATLSEARQMRDAAAKAKNSKTTVWYVYRRTPGSRAGVRAGTGGQARPHLSHSRFLPSGLGRAGSSADLAISEERLGQRRARRPGAHIIDMAKFISGEEITEVIGAVEETFVKEREIPAQGSAGGHRGGAAAAKGKMGKSDVDDATIFIARLSGGGLATFEATRFATGNQNRNGLEINGEKGAIRFDFEDMNHLYYYDRTAPRKVQGWTQIMATHGGDHPYAANWWPDAHIIGYEHTFINQTADFLNVIAGKQPVVPLPDFAEAYKTQQVLEAAVVSATERRPVKLSEIH